MKNVATWSEQSFGLYSAQVAVKRRSIAWTQSWNRRRLVPVMRFCPSPMGTGLPAFSLIPRQQEPWRAGRASGKERSVAKAYDTELWPAWTSGDVWSTQCSVLTRVGTIKIDLKTGAISLVIKQKTVEEELSDKNEFSLITKCLKHLF